MKELLKKLEEAEKRANAADEAWGNDPENEQLEIEFDEAYNEEWNARKAVINEIVRMTSGQIDEKTANTMLSVKRNELKALIERMA